MNHTQNDRLKQVTSDTLIVCTGDIGSAAFVMSKGNRNSVLCDGKLVLPIESAAHSELNYQRKHY